MRPLSYRVPARKPRRRPYDPEIDETPNGLWLLPAHAAALGVFRIVRVREFRPTAIPKLYIDILVANGREDCTLILPATLHSRMELDAWQFAHWPPWAYVVKRQLQPTSRWVLVRDPESDWLFAS